MNRNLALWISVLGGPIVWLCSFEARFALAPWACTFQSKAALLWRGDCGAAALRGLRTAWPGGSGKRSGEQGRAPKAVPIPRGNFMAIGGMVMSVGCFMIVIAQTIPEFMLGACQ